MRRFFVRKLPLIFAAAVGATAVSADSALRPLKDRAALLGWEAIGRVDLRGHGFCTGALIASDLVLTAAHCVFDDSGQPISPQDIRFRSGYVNGDALSTRKINKVAVAEDYRPETGASVSMHNLKHDVALLRLDSPIYSNEADPFVIYTDPKPGENVSVVSYGRGRSEYPSRQRDCDILQRHGGRLAFDCNVTYGSSGAPVFVRYGDRVRILSLISAITTDRDGNKVSLGMELPTIVAALKAKLRGSPVNAQPSQGAKRIRVGSGGAKSGAKFVSVGGG